MLSTLMQHLTKYDPSSVGFRVGIYVSLIIPNYPNIHKFKLHLNNHEDSERGYW